MLVFRVDGDGVPSSVATASPGKKPYQVSGVLGGEKIYEYQFC